MTFANLRALHAIIGDALDDMERVYNSHRQTTSPETSDHQLYTEENLTSERNGVESSPKGHKTSLSTSHVYASPPPSPSVATSPNSEILRTPTTDFPSLDAPYEPNSISETLTTHPPVIAAIGRIIAAAGQLAATVQVPFLTICDASMGYHLPACMRILEASHIVEILREAGSQGLHVQVISEKNGVDASKLAHILRLLATHHIVREVTRDTFSLNRISSTIDSGKSFADIQSFQEEGRLELKYKDTTGVAAFVGLCTDELQKSAAYMTETYYLSPYKSIRAGTDPARAPFCFAFDTVKSNTDFFGWLDGGRTPKAKLNTGQEFGYDDPGEGVEIGLGELFPPLRGGTSELMPERPVSCSPDDLNCKTDQVNPNKFRLERFGKAMSGTDGWEAPGAVFNAFDWYSLPKGSIVVDVGGGIGSTSMLLASAFSSSSPLMQSDHGEDESLGLNFVIQDRPFVCEMGEKAWKAQCPELLGTTTTFQAHDFFTPQPIKNAALFLLRVVLHDWPNDFARKILTKLRDAATPSTKLLLGDFVLPLACADDMSGLEDVEGVESILAPAPLLPNLGKASANVYWMDMTMQTIFNAQERTLRETVALAASAGWKIIKVSKTTGSLFGYMVAVPFEKPILELSPLEESDSFARIPLEALSEVDIPVHNSQAQLREEKKYRSDLEVIERASSRCGTPTFGSKLRLSTVQEALTRFGGGVARARNAISRSSSTPTGRLLPPPTLKPSVTVSSSGSSVLKKKSKPSPLSVPPQHTISDGMPQTPISANETHWPKFFPRRLSLANLRSPSQSASRTPPPPLPTVMVRQQSPFSATSLSPTASRFGMKRRASNAQVMPSLHKSPSIPESPTITSRTHVDSCSNRNSNPRSPAASIKEMVSSIPRRSSNAQLSNPSHWRKRSGTIVGPQQSTSIQASSETSTSNQQPNIGCPTTPSSASSRSYFSSVGSRTQSRTTSPINAAGLQLEQIGQSGYSDTGTKLSFLSSRPSSLSSSQGLGLDDNHFVSDFRTVRPGTIASQIEETA
ncbi:hypothetical protein CPB83DRAFT_809100 [Crepidotus variabilis]|uniref:O-methyltransferase C-terminal domain-containing protein n=1 Tax=Crepidotus variabilis TaxID=179855 RepID=A0A9P6JSZ2_9AGAR|nr:hypothetical protein CPB83DRAFT_809100 [Crepidotus variabilis]